MASVSVRECIRVCRRSVRHINWQTGTAVSEVDTSNLLLQKRMPPPECASLISNLVLISSCCPLRRIRWHVVFEETFFPSPSLHLSPSILHLSPVGTHRFSAEQIWGWGCWLGSNEKTMSVRRREVRTQVLFKGVNPSLVNDAVFEPITSCCLQEQLKLVGCLNWTAYIYMKPT